MTQTELTGMISPPKRTARFLAAALLACSSLTLAQSNDTGGDLNSKYQDALSQLKAAQDRKNELAAENEKLTARLADLQRQLEEAQRDQASFASRTWQLRSQSAAWEAFIKRYPKLAAGWSVFLERDPLAGPTTLPAAAELTDPLRPD